MTEKRMCRHCGRDGTARSMWLHSGGVYGECRNVEACERRRIAGDRKSDKAEGVVIQRQTEWAGNGFGNRTVHTAYQLGQVVGRWEKDSVSNFAFDKTGIVVMTYKAWREVLREAR